MMLGSKRLRYEASKETLEKAQSEHTLQHETWVKNKKELAVDFKVREAMQAQHRSTLEEVNAERSLLEDVARRRARKAAARSKQSHTELAACLQRKDATVQEFEQRALLDTEQGGKPAEAAERVGAAKGEEAENIAA